MGFAFLGGLMLAAASLGVVGVGQRGTLTALQLTARWAYLFFWPAYAGGGLLAVFGPAVQPLVRRGRELGLAFAAAMLMHMSMIAWIYYISPRPPLPLPFAIFFGIGLVFVYTLALCSIPALGARLPGVVRRVLFTVGMEYIALAFLKDFLHDPFSRGLEHLVGYLPFELLAAAGVLLRLIGYAKKWRARVVASRERRRIGSAEGRSSLVRR